jgi:predicted ATPase
LVRKSLLIADRSSGRTRYSMLETIRQFAEEQLVAHGEAADPLTKQQLNQLGRASERSSPNSTRPLSARDGSTGRE